VVSAECTPPLVTNAVELFCTIEVTAEPLTDPFKTHAPNTALFALHVPAIRFPTLTLADRIVVLADLTVIIEFADQVTVLAVVMVFALSRRVDVLRSKSHCPWLAPSMLITSATETLLVFPLTWL